jgi:hypothetical protein
MTRRDLVTVKMPKKVVKDGVSRRQSGAKYDHREK